MKTKKYYILRSNTKENRDYFLSKTGDNYTSRIKDTDRFLLVTKAFNTMDEDEHVIRMETFSGDTEMILNKLTDEVYDYTGAWSPLIYYRGSFYTFDQWRERK